MIWYDMICICRSGCVVDRVINSGIWDPRFEVWQIETNIHKQYIWNHIETQVNRHQTTNLQNWPARWRVALEGGSGAGASVSYDRQESLQPTTIADVLFQRLIVDFKVEIASPLCITSTLTYKSSKEDEERTRRYQVNLGRGDDTVGNHHRAQMYNSSYSSSNVSIRVVRPYHLMEIRQRVPCRAIRGSSISLNIPSPPPPS